MGKLVYSFFCQKGNERWFWSRSGGGIYCSDMTNNEIELIYMYESEGVIKYLDCLFEYIVPFENSLLFVPRYAKEILILDLGKNQVIKRVLPKEVKGGGEYFLGGFQTENEIILIPQCYDKILHIDKKNLLVKTSDFLYEKYMNSIENEQVLLNNEFIFRTFPVIYKDNIYLAFYNIPKILIYNIYSMKYLIRGTKGVENSEKIEIYEDDEVKILIIKRLDCIMLEDRDDVFLKILGEFLHDHSFLRAVSYDKYIYLFMEDGIFVLDKIRKEIKIADWFSIIKEAYLKRFYIKNGDRLQDTLYTFQDENTLFASFEFELEFGEQRCIIKVCGERVAVEYENIQSIEEIDVLLKTIDIGRCDNRITSENCVGKKIYWALN